MAKGKPKKDTKILYKKSNHLIQSRTCSESSDLYGILQIKKKMSQSQTLNLHGGTLKRDLSIETDICILRRYCRKQMNKLSTKSSGKTKYSTLMTEIGTIEEFQPDTSACGDSENNDLTSNILLDTTKILMDNLKDLLNDWVVNHLLAKPDTKVRLQHALYALLNRSDYGHTVTNESSSRRTYVLNKNSVSQEVKNKKIATSSSFCRKRNKLEDKKKDRKKPPNRNGQWSHSMPGSHRKAMRIISTLSIPRNIHKHTVYNHENKFIITKNVKQRNLLLSIEKSSKIIDLSSHDLLSISAKSFTKRCAALKSEERRKRQKKNRQIVFLPHASYKSATDSTSGFDNDHDDTILIKDPIRNENLEEMPSVMRSLFIGDPANITSTDNLFCMNDNTTMTDYNMSIQTSSYYSPKRKNNNNIIPNNKINTVSQCSKHTLPKLKSSSLSTNKSELCNKKASNMTHKSCRCTEIKARCVSSKCVTTTVVEKDLFSRSCKKCKPKTSKESQCTCPPKTITCTGKRTRTVCRKLKRRKLPQNPSPSPIGECCYHILKSLAGTESCKNIHFNIEIKIMPLQKPKIKNEDKCTSVKKSSSSQVKINKSPIIICQMETATKAAPNEPTSTKRVDIESTTDRIDTETKSNKIDSESDVKPINEPLIMALESVKRNNIFIPLLDGAISQDKYLTKSRSSTLTSIEIHIPTVDRSTITDDEVKNDINELKTIIKDLTKAAQSFIKEQSKKESVIGEITSYVESISRAVQFTSEAPVLASNLSKEECVRVKKNATERAEFYNRVMRKSNSYNVIESESIIRVTDMTSAANCSGKRSLSSLLKPHLGIDSERKSRFFAYYCEGCKRCDNYVQNPQSECSFPSHGVSGLPSWNVYTEPTTFMPVYINPKEASEMYNTNTSKNQHHFGIGESVEKVSLEVCGSSIQDMYQETYQEAFQDDMGRADEEEKGLIKERSKTTTSRGHVGYLKGFFFCLLMWIPISILCLVFYEVVLKHKIGMSPKSRRTLFNSSYKVKLSDLGF